MIRSYRALAAMSCSLAVLAVCALAAAGSCHARAESPENSASSAAQAVKVFDFDERPLGNFEDTPMYWRRMTGEGLPAYSGGRLDEEVGHLAPPAFQFTLRGGNIGYEYEHDDLPVTPDCDYLIEGWVRAENLVHARALLAVYLVDAAGERIAGSERVSQLVHAESDEPWQRVQFPLYVDAPEAARLRLQLWVLQSYAFAEPDPDVVDPITLQDVDAHIWFDDLAVLRLPRVVLSLSSPGGLVKPGASETLELDIQNTLPAALTAEVGIYTQGQTDAAPRLTRSFAIPAGAHEHPLIVLPTLEPGAYQARAVVATGSGQTSVADRTIRFAVLPPLPGPIRRAADFGVDLGPWPLADPAGCIELITDLGCGAIKIGLPIADVAAAGPSAQRLHQARDLAQQMVAQGIETTGVILAPATLADEPLARVLASDEEAGELVGPMFAYLAGCLSSLQLGAESVELEHPAAWDAAELERLRQCLQRYATIPTLVVPRSLLDELPPAGTDDSCWVPPELPTCSLPWHLSSLFSSDIVRGRWLSLGVPHDAHVLAGDRLADLARRVVLAKTANPGRVYVPAPFELSTSGGRPAWQPTDEYLALRELFHALAGTHAVAALNCGDDAAVLLFQRGQACTLAGWTWRAEPMTVELYTQPSGRKTLALAPTPRIVAGVDGPLLQLENSFAISPAFLQLHDREPPVLTLTNPYDSKLIGSIEITGPPTWQVAPNPIRLELAPGESLCQPLRFDIPPRQLAAEQQLRAVVHVQQPQPVELELVVPLQVGLQDIVMDATAWWEGEDLLVRQSLRNLSDEQVSFSALCQARDRPQVEAVFLRLQPSDTQDRTYRLLAARNLAGGQLWVAVQEIGGRRRLDQLVAIPP